MESLEYRLIRSRRKTVGLEVERDGSLTVRAPLRLPVAAIERVLREKADWIGRHRDRAALQADRYPPIQITEGGGIPWLGGTLTLRLTQGGRTERRGEELFLPKDGGEAALKRWLIQQARDLLARRADLYAGRMGVAPTGLRMSGARRQWGSCTGKNSLNFAWRLIFCAPAAVDYVVVHELAHITHKDHSAAFWKRVEEILPDYRERRAWLIEHQGALELL